MSLKFSFGFIIYIIGLCCGPINSGYTLAFSSPALRDLSPALSITEISIFTSTIYIGGIIGSLIIGYVMDKYGRKFGIICSSIPAISGWVLIHWCGTANQNVTQYVYVLYIARLLGGIACGMNMAATTVYLVEISPQNYRGTLASLNQLGITLGILLCYIMGNLFYYGQSAISALFFPLCLFCVTLWMPESPRWLVKTDRIPAAKRALLFFRKSTGDVEVELSQIIKTNQVANDNEIMSIFGLLSTKYQAKSLLVIKLMLLQQFTGINVFISYADVIFFRVLRSFSFISNISIVIGVFQFIFTIFSTLILDKLGRKVFLKLASWSMFISLLLMIFSLKVEIMIILIASMATYIIGFSIGWGPIPVILSTEIFPQSARSNAGSLAVLISWMGGYFVTFAYPLLSHYLSHMGRSNNVITSPENSNLYFDNTSNDIIFGIFALCTAYSIFFINRNLPETKGVSLDDVNYI